MTDGDAKEDPQATRRLSQGGRTESEPALVPEVAKKLLGKTLGDYLIHRLIGYGSMGVVFEAEHQALGRRVALKVLPPGLGATQKAIHRFLREAQAVAQLAHENIVPIYGIGEQDSTHFYAMQLLDGRPLDRVLKADEISPEQAARLILTAARAAHFAHQRGIIHRDIKPANMILCEDGRLVITDFGLARPERGASLTDSGAMVGTPLYMSPEQVRGRRQEVDRRTDVYSLGATLYELLTGRTPFQGTSTQEILQEILEVEPTPPRSYSRTIPAELEIICLRALDKSLKHRYPSALALAQDLERFLEGEPILARRTGPATRILKRMRKHRTISILTIVIVLITVGTSMLVWNMRQGSRQQAYVTAMESARSDFSQGLFLSAMEEFQRALTYRKTDPLATLGQARALFNATELWDERRKSETTLAREVLQDRFSMPRQAYAQALAQLENVIEQLPGHPLPILCRGRVRLRVGDAEVRQAGIGDLLAAEKLATNQPQSGWEPLALLGDLRLSMVMQEGERLHRDERTQLLQRALTNTVGALRRCRDERAESSDDGLSKTLGALHVQRASIFRQLFGLTEHLQFYLELCSSDAEQASQLDPRNRKAEDLLQYARSFRQGRSIVESGSERQNESELLGQMGTGLFSYFAAGDESERTKALAEILSTTGQALATGWRQTEDLRSDMVDTYLDSYSEEGTVVTADARERAQDFAGDARASLRRLFEGRRVTFRNLTLAKESLRRAMEKVPNHADYQHEYSFVCEKLHDISGEGPDPQYFKDAREHAEEAVQLSPDNPVFLAHAANLHLRQARQTMDRSLEEARRLTRRARRVAHELLDEYPSVQRLVDLVEDIEPFARVELKMGTYGSDGGND